jgi:alkanesulfonate monooxygenase SsuD/methylene tetrahydromethanopterin reductase-like flavin-dependent oxidoreductase (luciferase family)
MQVGVGLPTTLPGASAALITGWARQADAGPFSSLGVLDRLIYESYDPLVTLGLAAGLTQRIQLVTMIVISPLRQTAMLAKQAISLDALSGGRLTLGLALGARREDYERAEVDYGSRGKRFGEQLGALRTYWETEGIRPGPARAGGPAILVGGSSDAALARVARYADGYVHGGGPPRLFARVADTVRAAWIDAGRPGQPLLWGQGYFALGSDDERTAGAGYLRDYYAFTGPFAEKIVEGLLTTPQAIVQFIRGYAEAGCDELVLLPTVADLSQVERLADVLG